MLQRPEQIHGLAYEHGEPQRRIDLVDLYAFIKSHRRIIIGWSTVCLVVALVYVFTATPLYTATADLNIDTRQIKLFKNNDQPVGDNSIAGDSSAVDTQVEELRSRNVALAVVKDLKLTDDPEFIGGGAGVDLLSLFSGVNEDPRRLSDSERERRAVATLINNLTVRRVGTAYTIQVSYRSADPQKSARIANGVADAYINNQLSNKYQAARRASIWLQERIAELRSQSNAAARAVQEYKEKNDIVDTAGDRRGLLSDLQVQEMNTQMIAATAATAEAKAKLDRVQEVLKSPEPGQAVGTVSDTLKNDVITRLRTEYLDDGKRVAEWSARVGRNHLAVIGWRNEMKELQQAIVDELQRIAQSYKSDYEIARAREDSIRNSLSKQVEKAGATSKAQVDLKELETASQSYHTIFENFLQKYTEAVQQQSFPISDAHVISAATPPTRKSHPKTTLIALLGLLVGVTAGLGHSVASFNFDRAVRRPRVVEERLGISCLGMVPLVARRQMKKQLKDASSRALPASAQTKTPDQPGFGSDLMSKVTDDPFSHFSEAIRSVKTALDIAALTRPMGIIGVISSIPHEGKSTIAANLAQSFRAGGHSTLLVDADMRHPTLSRRFGANAKAGLLEVIAGLVPFKSAMRVVEGTQLQFMPTILKHRIPNSGDLLSSERMREVLIEAQEHFDRVIIDLPPLGAISDSRAISPLLDALVVVVRWGSTRVDVLESALADLGGATDKIAGVVLNRVNYTELKHMDAHSHGYYYNKDYSQYGYTYAHE